MPYFVAKFTNTTREAKMIEKLRPEAEFCFMSACIEVQCGAIE